MEIRPGTIYGLSPSAVLRPVWVSWGCSLDSKLILVAVGCARASRKEGTGASPPLPGTRKGLLRLQTQTAHWLCEVGWASGWAHGMPQRPREAEQLLLGQATPPGAKFHIPFVLSMGLFRAQGPLWLHTPDTRFTGDSATAGNS